METDRSIREGGTPSPKRPQTTATPTSNEAGESKGPLSMTLLADPDLLDCPICFEPLCSPVYQCENGHIACSSCCTTILKNKCSNCSLPIGNFRCRAIEKILESVRVRCRYTSYGCTSTAMLAYSSNAVHERTCCYIPCSCPIIGCDFVDNSKLLYDHFALEHKDSSKQFNFKSEISISMDTTQKHVILREEKEGLLFVLNRCIEAVGSYFNVVCVAPPSFQRFLYELTASKGDDSIKVKMCMEKMSKWTPQTPANMRILIPTNFISTTQLLTLDLIIQKKPRVQPSANRVQRSANKLFVGSPRLVKARLDSLRLELENNSIP